MGFRDLLFGKEAEIKTQVIEDPKKAAIATPLSKFLGGQISEGVPRFEGRITGEFPEEGFNRASEFLALDAGEFFQENIADPALQTFKEDLFPLVREEFAGSLSGSGRFRTEEAAVSKFTRDLAGVRADFLTDFPQAQFKVAQAVRAENDKEAKAQYNDWLKSLPGFNPALQQSISFLQESTNTGKTILSFLDQGSEGIMKDLIGIVAEAGLAYVTGGASIPASIASRATNPVQGPLQESGAF